ncbi:hypothetical protein GOP47_0007196 [Adiantum capillus-veneris]|uniref:Lon proteolytic domain-containing protein n=1 Tax=Adiantum capillus-veneris TaxID=13818 RepID=A0A9D4V128_ADICA|nr:hypothetical protein GOP47_0007196 [Adiantum capillus-veneris]
MRGKRDVEVAKAGYKEALERGDREEQARWANQVGHACKERGQYVEALKWFRMDYDISSKRKSADASNQGFLMPTCQSLGEIYYRLNDYEEALIFQKRHFQLAEETDNLVEQQRASTQLGRTYLEMYEQKDEFSALENAKQFFKISMEIARTLKENPPSRDSPSFVKELVDAYNNMGLLMMVIDDHKQAISYFEQGLRICNDEELREDDDARSRLHHNLGRIYCERRDWEKSKHHTQTDISICQRLPHPQGEAKGFINLGEMHFKRQRYEEATRCFERALTVAQSLEDEDELVSTAQRNLDVVAEAEEKLLQLTVGEQQLKKLQRKRLVETKVRASHRTEEYKLLIELIGLAEYLQAWEKHLKLAKTLKSVVKEMGDMEKLGDAMETVGESYYSLRRFLKAKKWILRSFDLCKRIGHIEGQSVAMINYGNVLDSLEDWEQALKAYKDSYEIARSQGRIKMLPQQINALENLQYCYLVRMKSISDARAIQSKIQGLKELKDKEDGVAAEDEHCSETDSESGNPASAAGCENDGGNLQKQNATFNMRTTVPDSSDDSDDADASPASFATPNNLHSDNKAPWASVQPPEGINTQGANGYTSKVQVPRMTDDRPEKEVRNVKGSNRERRLRKRPRVVLLDEEEIQDFGVAADIGSETHASAEEAKESPSARIYPENTSSPIRSTGVHDHQDISELESVRSGSLSCTLNEDDVLKFACPRELQRLLEDQRDNFTTDVTTSETFTVVNKTESAREEMRAELGDTDDDDDDVIALERKMQGAGMPGNVWKHAQRELRRLRKMQPQQPGHSSARAYLELLADLPWQVSSEERELDLAAAKERLDSEHYGLRKVKKRIIEYLAVRKLKPGARGPVLCFVGPPGVGKTSLASSIAGALGRRFIRISLGGVKDEADIRGHRRTYIGSMPGRLIEGIKRVGVNNPVMLLDEIDKTGTDVRGDPASALLEVLDPEQHKTFNDHYLNVPFDLSKVVFVATANRIQPIPPPLLDRMEVIELPGYTLEEKLKIAVRHLIPRVLDQHGITSDHLQIPEPMVELMIQRYTREAGVWNLERHLAAFARAAAVKVAEREQALRISRDLNPESTPVLGGSLADRELMMEVEAIGMPLREIATSVDTASPLLIDEAALENALGPPEFDGREAAERVTTPGVAIGLVWTAFGGEVQFVEATAMVGKGDLHLTGQPGDVFKESAQIALTWVRARAAELKLAVKEQGNLMDNRDVHIHFPAGAVPKDGPSAGVTLVTALVSLFLQRCVRVDTAMTGEMTLRGLVLPVGGVKDKILAAHRCGIKRVILPEKNAKDLMEVPSAILANVEGHLRGVIDTLRFEVLILMSEAAH